MNLNKKGVHPHLLAILIISIIMTLLIMTAFSPIFTNDHEKCQNFDYQIISKKKADNGAKINIKNTGNSKIYFEFNGEKKDEYFITPDEKKEFTIHTQEKEIEIVPIYIDLNQNIYECNGKSSTIKLSTLI